MTDDEKTRFELLKLRIAYAPGQARELAEKDYEWIKRSAPHAEDSAPSGNPIESQDVARAKVVADALSPPQWEPIERMQES